MWYDGKPTRTSRSLGDNRVADLQIGDSEVRSAVLYYLVAWWRAFQRGVDPSANNPLFGQMLLRQFVSAHLLLSLGIDLLRSIIGYSYDRKTAIFRGRSTQGALAAQCRHSAKYPNSHVGFRRTRPAPIAPQRPSRPIVLLIRRQPDLFDVRGKLRAAEFSVNFLEDNYGPVRPRRRCRGRPQ